MVTQSEKVAVIGGGVAGITAAHLLSRKHSVTLFERNDYLGGHTNTIQAVREDGEEVAVDTGFIVCNTRNYPLFYKLLAQLEVPLRNSDMSFGFSADDSALQYVGPAITDFLATPGNLLAPGFLRLIRDQRRFNSRALKDLRCNSIGDRTLGSYLSDLKLSRDFISDYLVPLAASIWSSPDLDILEFPALTFITFFNNHGMLELSKRPQWQTVIGGSHTYVRSFRERFNGTIHLKTPVKEVLRAGPSVNLTLADGRKETFDRVIMACHADEALGMLGDATYDERQHLGAWRYQENHTVLHTDTSVLPPRQRLWASWNYRRQSRTPQSPVAITYYMNRLQGLRGPEHYCVTLNRADSIKRSAILYETTYTHPVYTPDSVASQDVLRRINGANRTHYCGSYFGYGFHEDAVKSSVEVAAALGIEL